MVIDWLRMYKRYLRHEEILMTQAIPKLLPLDQVAEALGVSIHSIRRFISAGRLRSTRIGTRVLVSTDEVLRAQQYGLGAPSEAGQRDARAS